MTLVLAINCCGSHRNEHQTLMSTAVGINKPGHGIHADQCGKLMMKCLYLGGGGGGGSKRFTCPYPLKVQACPPLDERLATQSRVPGREVHTWPTVYEKSQWLAIHY